MLIYFFSIAWISLLWLVNMSSRMLFAMLCIPNPVAIAICFSFLWVSLDIRITSVFFNFRSSRYSENFFRRLCFLLFLEKTARKVWIPAFPFVPAEVLGRFLWLEPILSPLHGWGAQSQVGDSAFRNTSDLLDFLLFLTGALQQEFSHGGWWCPFFVGCHSFILLYGYRLIPIPLHRKHHRDDGTLYSAYLNCVDSQPLNPWCSFASTRKARFFIFQNFFELQHIRKNTVHNTTHGSLFTNLSTAFDNPFIDVIVKGQCRS